MDMLVGKVVVLLLLGINDSFDYCMEVIFVLG